jgi:hypothetical protein
MGQAADIWSLGCVYSEAAIWIANGYKGLEEYRRQRKAEIDNIPDFDCGDCFHNGREVLKTVGIAHRNMEKRLQLSDHITKSVIDTMVKEMLWKNDRPSVEALQHKVTNILEMEAEYRQSDTEMKVFFRPPDGLLSWMASQTTRLPALSPSGPPPANLPPSPPSRFNLGATSSISPAESWYSNEEQTSSASGRDSVFSMSINSRGLSTRASSYHHSTLSTSSGEPKLPTRQRGDSKGSFHKNLHRFLGEDISFSKPFKVDPLWLPVDSPAPGMDHQKSRTTTTYEVEIMPESTPEEDTYMNSLFPTYIEKSTLSANAYSTAMNVSHAVNRSASIISGTSSLSEAPPIPLKSRRREGRYYPGQQDSAQNDFNLYCAAMAAGHQAPISRQSAQNNVSSLYESSLCRMPHNERLQELQNLSISYLNEWKKSVKRAKGQMNSQLIHLPDEHLLQETKGRGHVWTSLSSFLLNM